MEEQDPDSEKPSSLRPATLDDLPFLVEIETRVQKAPWSRQSFEQELSKSYSHVLVLTDDETDSVILAYVVYWSLDKDWQILSIAVDLPYRGLGYAKRMMDLVLKTAIREGAKRVLLEVRKSNLPAIQLYQNHFFDIIHIRKRFYSDGEDAYQMELNLTADVARQS